MAGPDAKFSARFVKMGVVPELASSYYLVARAGFGLANRMMLTGETIDAAEAQRIGLVDELVSDGDSLLTRATQLAKQIGENPPGALGAVKELVTANMAEPDIKEVQKRSQPHWLKRIKARNITRPSQLFLRNDHRTSKTWVEPESCLN